MKILKKENWWIWFLLFLFSSGTSNLVLGALLDVYREEAWYAKWIKKIPKWLLVSLPFLYFLCFIILGLTGAASGGELTGTTFFVAAIMSFAFLFIWICVMVFFVQILCQTSAKLEVPGHEFYLSSYVWILCLIIPYIGWVFVPVMLLYLNIANIIMLYRGKGEKFLY